MKEEMTIDRIKKFFEESRIRKYNNKLIIRFLEDNIYETFITPKFDIINDYKDFNTDFDNCLNDLSKNAKDILIQKYGMIDGKPKTASEISFNNKLSTDGVGTSVRNSILFLKKSKKIEELKKYFIIHKSYNEEARLENIKYIIEFAKQLEGDNKND